MTQQGQGTGDRGQGPGDKGQRPGTGDQGSGERDTPMTGIYASVMVLEALIIAALWVLGRMYS
jgi:hypothetical protein